MVFVDEPTTGVDVGTRRFIWDRIREAARERCVVLAMHDMGLTLTLTLSLSLSLSLTLTLTLTLSLALTRCVVLTTHYMDLTLSLALPLALTLTLSLTLTLPPRARRPSPTTPHTSATRATG